MADPFEEFTRLTNPEFKAVVERVDAVIAAAGMELDRAIKWGQLTYAKNADFHHWICAIKITRKFVGLTFHFGGLLEDPDHKLIAGESKFGRKIEFQRLEDIDAHVISGFVRLAVDRLDYFKENWRERKVPPAQACGGVK